DGSRSPQRHLRRPCRSHAPGDAGAPGEGRGDGDGTGGAVRHEHARHLQAPEGVGTRGADRARPRGPVAAGAPAAGAAARGERVDGAVPAVLGAELRSIGRVSSHTSEQGAERWRRQRV
ncbi:MAG: Transcriptional regulator, ArsR family, partial [uncultured Gemmatimonadetes bacterium]